MPCNDPNCDRNLLAAQIADLELKLEFLSQHRTLALGMTGERLVAAATSGRISRHGEGHDVVVRSGDLIEVKRSTIGVPVRSKPNSGKRWAWNRVFGQSGNKQYDWLVLIGDTEPEFRKKYKFPSYPYIAFLIHRNDVANYTTGGETIIMLGTNPKTASGRASPLYTKHQVDPDDIEKLISRR